ncbi:DMT family transporter [Paenibacillus sp. DMB20]|uniref:DMT family transporter n=1 Tax=Paenibacillus sp. DMB20 TaxID=1642570 RepID=UPI0006278FB8|nr:multidrug efflux SMR transporter [Paenibacillus sp. DMB20]KKO52226.1 transporter [Paenibacillus sp. DMB20]
MVFYLFLAGAIVFEVFGSTMLKLSHGFTRFVPVLGVVAGYIAAFYMLSKALQVLPLGLSYATWSGVGTILTVIIGVYLFKEKINRQGLLGIAILTIGIVLLNLAK